MKNGVDDNVPEPVDPEWERAKQAFRDGDFAGSLYLLKKMEKEGAWDAFVEIGNIYEIGGNGVERDYSKAKKYFEKALRIANDPKAYLCLGRIYYLGHGVAQDFTKAYSYFYSIRGEEDPVVLYMLGRMLERGEGVERNINEAIQYYKRSAELGHLFARRAYGRLKIMEGHILTGARILFSAALEIARVSMNLEEGRRIKSIWYIS